MRYKPYLVDYQEIEGVRRPVLRLKFLLSLLDRNPEWKSRVAATLRSIIIDTRDVELFASTGLPEEMGFWSEFLSRCALKFMPTRPLSEGGVPVMSALFPDPEDLQWFSGMPPEIMQKLIELIWFEKPADMNFSAVTNDIEEALLILTSQVRSIAMTYQVRRRLGDMPVKRLPFFELTREVEVLLRFIDQKDQKSVDSQAQKIRGLISQCFDIFSEVYRHLDVHGVSLRVVYLIESGHAKLKRITDLVNLVSDPKLQPERLIYFLSQLISENQERHSILSLFEQNTRLISQKIVERSAETGEHYIARNRKEFWEMFRRAFGGGAIVSLLVIVKVIIGIFKLPEAIVGVFYSLNYSIGFVAIQLQGFT
ncbi:MAG: hypothetical protein KDD22_05100, partial [Bdellovibrionales bacterium]|nr:hypothetical protein [Bdellovibrionales bacterium]